ncbi:MAG TPA: ribonuclease Z [Rhodothermales bacterium]|nr:ribonuclease Z [Rhodothermales bacterium]
MTEIIPLGTASATPTRTRHLSACALRRQGRLLLFDCGEGTQYRLLEAGISRRLDAVFITHLHGDHVYGLPGMLSTLGLMGRPEPITLVGPADLERVVRALPGLGVDDLPFALDFVALEEGFAPGTVVYAQAGFSVTAQPLEHRIFCAGYRYEEAPRPGRLDAARARAAGVTAPADFEALKAGRPVTAPDGRVLDPAEYVGPARPAPSFAYVLDTRPCDGGRALAQGASLLLHEATFTQRHAARAVETGHSTARQAAEVARDAGARRLLLTHFSARYPDPAPLVEEARRVFPSAEAAEELRVYVLGEEGGKGKEGEEGEERKEGMGSAHETGDT